MKKYLLPFLLITFISVNASIVFAKTTKTKVITPSSYTGLVTSVTDGDTIKLLHNGKIETVRILGIDTPEKYTTRTGYIECYGKEASDFTSATLSGQIVTLVTDVTQDKKDSYGRILGHIFLQDGTYFEELALQKGVAFRYVYKKITSYDARLKKAEKEAKKGKIGVWGICDGKRKPVDELTDIFNELFPVELPKNTNSSTISPASSSLPTTPTPPSPIISTPTALNPISNIQAPSPIPTTTESSANFSCSVSKKTCGAMNSCEEARFYLNTCGITKLDGDKDGTPCESICK